MARHVVATVDEIQPGERKIVEVAGRSIGIFNVRGEFFALRNRCPHQGGPLCSGRLWGSLQAKVPGEYLYSREGEILRCPWHGWEFDLRTGRSWVDPSRTRVRRYEVSIEESAPPGAKLPTEGEVPAGMAGWQRGAYVAETYPVSVERRYVVVEVDG